MAARRAFRTCTICEAGCGLAIDIDDAGRIAAVRGDKDDPLSAGYVCPKSQAMAGVAADPDLIRAPMLKVDGRWVTIGWDEAIARAVDGLARVRDAYGAEAIATYAGNPVSNNPGALLYSGALIGALGTKQNYTAGSIDAYPKQLANLLMYGDTALNPIPDIDRTDLLVVIGANPMISNGSIWTAPGLPNRIKALKARGGRLVVIDPRRTETAAIADDHLPIRSAADALLLLACVHVLFDEALVSDRLGAHAKNLDMLRSIAAAWPPEKVAAPTGIDADRIRWLARDIAGARAAAVYGRVGTCCTPFGSIASWLIEAINILTGNVDREGGLLFARPLVAAPWISSGFSGSRVPHGRFRTRVRGLPELGARLPAAALAEEMEGRDGVRALVTIAGNPARSLPNSARFVTALQGLDFRVCIDFYLNETTRHADLILPPLDGVYRSSFTLFFGPYNAHSYARYSPPLLNRPAEGMHDWEILLRLGAGLRGVDPVVHHADHLRGLAAVSLARAGIAADMLSPDDALAQLDGPNGPDKLCDLFLRVGEFGERFGANPEGLTLAKLAAADHGIDYGLAPAQRIGTLLRTPDRLIDLAPAAIVADLARLGHWLADGRFDASASSFRLNGRRDLRSMNSWLHNLPNLAKGPERHGLHINPADAARLGIADGDLVEIESHAGRTRAPAVLSDAIGAGELSLPHGWGHDDPAARLDVARQRPGANFNLLAPETMLDAPSANAVFNAIPVHLRPVTAPAPAAVPA